MDSQRTILRSVGTVTLLTLAVKSVGFLQQVMVADRFGTGRRVEAYFLSLAVPGLLASLIPVTLNAGLLPVYLSLRQGAGEGRARRFLGVCLGRYLGGLTILSVAVALLAGPLVSALAGRGEERELIVRLTWVGAPLILLAGLFSTLASIENARGKFFLTTSLGAAPAVAIILCLAVAPRIDVWAIAVGMLVGMGAQLTVIAVSARRALPELPSLFGGRDPAFAEMRSRILPLFISSSIVRLNPLIDQLMASRLPPGSLSALAYADRIMHVLQALFITSVSTVGFVSFSKQLAANDRPEVVRTIHSLLRTLAFILLPVSAGAIIVARPLVSVLLQRGAFDASSSIAVSQALTFFSLGLFPIGASFLLPQVYIALGATRTLAVVAVGENVLNVVLNLLLMRRFAHAGIAFSTSLVYTVGVVVLALVLPSRLPGLRWKPIVAPLLQILAATAVMIACCLTARALLTGCSDLIELVSVCLVGVISYLGASRLMRLEDLTRLRESMKWTAHAAE